MKIECQFLFNPLNQNHSTTIRILSVITNIALTALTGGIYFLVFLAARSSSHTVTSVPHHEMIKAKQQDHLVKLNQLALLGEWQHLREHTAHPHSGFDWWMFPTDRDSQAHGALYKVTAQEVALMRQDPVFMRSYREGVCLVAKAWGWDLEAGRAVTNGIQTWTGYEVRLGKMLDSLRLFGQNDLRQVLSQLIHNQGLALNLTPWVQALLH